MISEDQSNILEAFIADNELDRDEFLQKIAGVNDICHITQADFPRCYNALYSKVNA